jgi:hypothetical protein
VLFGLGSAGGIIEHSISMPQSKDSTKVQITATNYGGLRETLDLNRVLLDGRLRFRAALLNDDKKFRQEEAFEKNHRGFFSWDYRLHKGRKDAFLGDTTVRGYVEAGKANRNPPDSIPPTIGYEFWYNVDAAQKLVGRYPGVNLPADLASKYRTVAQGAPSCRWPPSTRWPRRPKVRGQDLC